MEADREDIYRRAILYRRLEALGVADRVRCWFLQKPDGSAGSLIVDDREGFVADLVATGRFCVDTRGGGMLHGGFTSLREHSPDTNQALHVSVGCRDLLWAHTDSVAPNADSRADGHCVYDRRRVARHIRRDVLHVRRDLEALLFAGPRLAKRPGGRLPDHPGSET
ncbi:MAG TPA: hypothetical protein VFW71_08030 [Actinomycetota bacterium]|nr:hypothetical protein [Actinomycetota bacterium]